MGGNLSVLVATLGTPYAPDTRDAILFLEDVNEKPYRIDRMLTQLRQLLRERRDGCRDQCGSEVVGKKDNGLDALMKKMVDLQKLPRRAINEALDAGKAVTVRTPGESDLVIEKEASK